MGFRSFLKKLFAGESATQAELDAARARHGIIVSEAQKAMADKEMTEQEHMQEEFDAWEELKNYRMNFFLGSWVTRKIRPVGEEKVRRELDALEKKKRLQEERERKEKGED